MRILHNVAPDEVDSEGVCLKPGAAAVRLRYHRRLTP